jgi:hypothetical protein
MFDETKTSDADLDVRAQMDSIRRGIEDRRQSGPLYEDEVEPMVRKRLRAALEGTEGKGQFPEDLFDDDETWNVEAVCELRSHRPRLGKFLVGLKKTFVRPFVKWLLEWAEVNFDRQRRLNEGCVTLLHQVASELARLESKNSRLEIKLREIESGGGRSRQRTRASTRSHDTRTTP